jgi:TPP-dependent indolepyruvate ferredoxin oxidoreductase alpha subunit
MLLIEQILTDLGFDFPAFIRMNLPYPLNQRSIWELLPVRRRT